MTQLIILPCVEVIIRMMVPKRALLLREKWRLTRMNLEGLLQVPKNLVSLIRQTARMMMTRNRARLKKKNRKVLWKRRKKRVLMITT